MSHITSVFKIDPNEIEAYKTRFREINGNKCSIILSPDGNILDLTRRSRFVETCQKFYDSVKEFMRPCFGRLMEQTPQKIAAQQAEDKVAAFMLRYGRYILDYEGDKIAIQTDISLDCIDIHDLLVEASEKVGKNKKKDFMLDIVKRGMYKTKSVEDRMAFTMYTGKTREGKDFRDHLIRSQTEEGQVLMKMYRTINPEMEKAIRDNKPSELMKIFIRKNPELFPPRN